MLTTAIELLKIIEDKGFKAYLVGGCVRDYIIGINLTDIDVASSATMYDLSDIKDFIFMKSNRYGSSILIYKNIKFELTTFREEGTYLDGRRPNYYKYTSSLSVDAKRRDFKMNCLYMDKNRNIIDIYGGILDIKNKTISCVLDPYEKLSEDSLRILRALRFATTLNFSIEEETLNAIIKNKNMLKIIPYERRIRELDKIFISDNRSYGIELLVKTGIDKVLELNNLDKIVPIDDINGIWAQIRNHNYVLTKSSRKIVEQIEKILDNNIDIMTNKAIYKYGLYICMIVCKIKGQNIDELINIHSKLPIASIKDIDIKTADIIDTLKIEDKRNISNIYNDLVNQILTLKLNNKKTDIILYLKKRYNMLK